MKTPRQTYRKRKREHVCLMLMPSERHAEAIFEWARNPSDDSDIWDDTALIKAYDKAVASFKNALKNGESSDPSVAQEKTPGTKRKNNKKNKGRKKSGAPPFRKNGNETLYSTDESEKSSRSPGNRQQHNPTTPKPAHWNSHSPPVPGLARFGIKHNEMPPFLSGWPPPIPTGPPLIPPPPPMGPDSCEDDDALGSMLIAWYMSGYHTGYYLGLKQSRMEAASVRHPYNK
uniref:Survival motor neuron protein 1-like isoform X3 n=1 Tax=Geotrypetes seraphini TaxID=260995 RepID=A0A6P8QDQ2_GEOSA|nr:survival motor neuron protein 1-like isoform X3 [Geotrypetes seraphini]